MPPFLPSVASMPIAQILLARQVAGSHVGQACRIGSNPFCPTLYSLVKLMIVTTRIACLLAGALGCRSDSEDHVDEEVCASHSLIKMYEQAKQCRSMFGRRYQALKRLDCCCVCWIGMSVWPIKRVLLPNLSFRSARGKSYRLRHCACPDAQCQARFSQNNS